MKTKNSKKPSAGQTPEQTIITLTIAGVNQELDAYNDVPAHELSSKSFHIESARRDSERDLREATIKLKLKKLRGGQPSESSKQIDSDLAGELEEITAFRKLETIFKSIAHAADELGAIACQAKPHSDRLAEMNARAGVMKTKLADYEARDVRADLASLGNWRDESRWARALLDGGKWRNTSLDFQDAAFEEELANLHEQGRYTGELNREGMEQRITLLEERISALDARLENQLTSGEMSEMPRLLQGIKDLDAAILEENRYSHSTIASARFQEAKFGRLLEAARIAAHSVAETYQITLEMIALQEA